MNIQMTQKFSQKARGYVCAHEEIKLMTEEKKKGLADNNEIGECEYKLSHEEMEKIRKKYKTHRDANCTDCKFIEKVMRECIVIEG